MKKLNRSTAALFAMPILLAACGGGSDSTVDNRVDAASVHYNLPATAARVELRLLLTKCEAGADKTADPVLEAVPSLTVTPMASASPSPNLRFQISSSALKSFSKNRQVAVALHDNGALRTVNASVEDRTPQIIGNILGLGVTLAGKLLDAPVPPLKKPVCKPSVENALTMANELAQEIAEQRAKIRDNEDSDDLEKRMKRVDSLAAELTRIQMAHLTLTLRRNVTFEKGVYGGAIDFERNAFSHWLMETSKVKTKLFKLAFCVLPTRRDHYDNTFEGAPEKCSLQEASNRAAILEVALKTRDSKAIPTRIATVDTASIVAGITKYGLPVGITMPEKDLEAECPDGITCAKTIVLREPIAAQIQFYQSKDGTGFQMRSPEVLGKFVPAIKKGDPPTYSGTPATYVKRDDKQRLSSTNLLIGQWGTLSYFDMNVGFGDRKNLTLSLDAFGRKTNFGTNTTARGEGVTSFVSSSVTSVSNILEQIEGRSARQEQATIDSLTRQQNLNRLEACRMVIENGGFTCPES